MEFTKRFEKNPNEAIRIVKERTRLMKKMRVDCCFYKLMPDGETKLIESVRRVPVIKNDFIYARIDGRLSRCTLEICDVKDGKQSCVLYTLVLMDGTE